jgi:hypothetical protein
MGVPDRALLRAGINEGIVAMRQTETVLALAPPKQQ